jgi:hypothetical protein
MNFTQATRSKQKVCFPKTDTKYKRSFAMGIKFQDGISRLENKLTNSKKHMFRAYLLPIIRRLSLYMYPDPASSQST